LIDANRQQPDGRQLPTMSSVLRRASKPMISTPIVKLYQFPESLTPAADSRIDVDVSHHAIGRDLSRMSSRFTRSEGFVSNESRRRGCDQMDTAVVPFPCR
jgi:hypothetical protein